MASSPPGTPLGPATASLLTLIDAGPTAWDNLRQTVDAASTAPRVPLADLRLRRSEVRLLAFRKAGLYRFEAANVQPSEELGLQTLGPDNTLKIVVRVA